MNAAGNHPLLSFCIAVAIFAAGTLTASALLPPAGVQKFFAEVKHGNFRDVAVGLLAAQAALIALVFPLIIALIGVLFDLRTTSGARLNIFLKETEAVVVGGSSLCLSAALAIQLLFFSHLPPAISAVVLLFSVFWFVLNVGLLAFFLFKTLDFVRPERRGVLFRRYIVNVAWRAELLRLITYNRLTGAVEYGYLPATPDDLENGPAVLTSPMTLDSIPAAVSIHLGESSNLADVHFPVLRVIAEEWLAAARRKPRGTGLVWLVFEPVPMRTYEGDTVLARSPADLPLGPLHRFLIRLAFRFQKALAERGAPDTSALLKEYMADLVPLIDAGRLQEFTSGLDQIVDLHVFFFKIAEAPRDTTSDEPVNFAEIDPFAFRTLGDSWAREYLDVFKRAVARLSVEPEFFATCAFLAVRLYREVKEVARPSALKSITVLALTLFWRLIEWAQATQQAESGSSGSPGIAFQLSAARSAVYAEAWRDLVAGWERLGTEIASFQVSSPDEWSRMASRFAPVWEHLQNTATMVAAGAKGGDRLAVNWSTDMLIKWHEHVHRGWQDGEHDLLSEKFLITPDVFLEPWDTVSAVTRPLVGDTLSPHSVFGAAAANAWQDVQLVLISVLIHWAIQTTPTGAAAVAAHRLLRGEGHDHDSYSGRQRPIFESTVTAFEAIIRMAHSERHRDGGHSAAMARFAERLDDLTTEPYVSGRIYSSSTVHDVYQLRTEQALVLAALARRAPVGGRIPGQIERALQAISSEDDSQARRLLGTLEQLRDALTKLDPVTHGPIFEALSA